MTWQMFYGLRFSVDNSHTFLLIDKRQKDFSVNPESERNDETYPILLSMAMDTEFTHSVSRNLIKGGDHVAITCSQYSIRNSHSGFSNFRDHLFPQEY